MLGCGLKIVNNSGPMAHFTGAALREDVGEMRKRVSRATFLKLAAGALPASILGAAAHGQTTSVGKMLTRPIPSSGEALSVVGLGTWQTFDVGSGAKERAPLG